MTALSDAETVAVDGAWDDDGEAESDDEAEPDGEGESLRQDEAVGEGELDRTGPAVGVLVGLLLGLDVVAEPLGDDEREGDGEGEGFRDALGEGDGEGFRDALGEGDGAGDGVLDAGSSWQVFPVLAEAVRLSVALTGLSESACAVPDQAASAPKITEPPASKLSAVARSCPERTDIALSTMLVTVTA